MSFIITWSHLLIVHIDQHSEVLHGEEMYAILSKANNCKLCRCSGLLLSTNILLHVTWVDILCDTLFIEEILWE